MGWFERAFGWLKLIHRRMQIHLSQLSSLRLLPCLDELLGWTAAKSLRTSSLARVYAEDRRRATISHGWKSHAGAAIGSWTNLQWWVWVTMQRREHGWQRGLYQDVTMPSASIRRHHNLTASITPLVPPSSLPWRSAKSKCIKRECEISGYDRGNRVMQEKSTNAFGYPLSRSDVIPMSLWNLEIFRI